ncbi:hypothetical protein G6F66_005006 [Rhizopus arrhizus]|nr:hypothetical protein G6F66_005006 [Rhizopus arrhizus]
MSLTKADPNKQGWENSEFPIVCETCLGDNPYVRMICQTPFTVFRWQPGTNMRHKKTEICQTCARVKNVCQTCILDLQYGLPVEVRDKALNVKSEAPSTNINRQYYAQNVARNTEGSEELYNPGRIAPESKEMLNQLSRKEPYYKRNRAHVCSFFLKGECNRGDACPYRHEEPTETNVKQNFKDRYHGINDPVAQKMLNRARHNLSPPEDKSITSLFITGVEEDISQEDLNEYFSVFGDIKSIIVAHKKKCAFVNFATRMSTELAAAKIAEDGLILKEHSLVVVWAKPKPQESKKQDDRSRKTLPVLKTDREVEEEGLGRLSIDAPPSFTEEPESISKKTDPVIKTKLAAIASGARHSIGFDVPGAVHTIMTPKLKTERQLDSKLVVIMVGLPARGKSYIVKKLRRYLNWLQYETKVFNVGNARRVNETSQHHDQSAQFFNPDNKDGAKIRDELAMMVLDQLIDWLKSGGRVAIHDATNSTIQRRKLLIDRLSREPEIKVLLLESVCTDKKVLERNFRLKLSGPDYKDKDPAVALSDFRHRVANYERAYETVGDWEEENDIQYCKLVNVGKKVIAFNISGYLSGQCIFYLMNFNLAERQIFVTRHGESEDNITGRIGGDAALTEKGRKFSRALARFVKSRRISFALDLAKRKIREEEEAKDPMKDSDEEEEERDEGKRVKERAESISNSQFTIWTSMLKRSMQTAESFDPDEYDIKQIRFLNEINSGSREGMTYEEIKQSHPQEFEARQKNKLFYRYPGMGGESYIDVIHRLQSMIIELERMSQSCLIITHRVVLRILLGYLLEWSQTQMPHMLVPIHTVYELRPKPYGVELTIWSYDEEKDEFEVMNEETQ